MHLHQSLTRSPNIHVVEALLFNRKWWGNVQTQVGCHFFDDLRRNALQLSRVRVDECILTDSIYQPRNAPRLTIYLRYRCAGENLGSMRVRPGELQTPRYVSSSFFQVQG